MRGRSKRRAAMMRTNDKERARAAGPRPIVPSTVPLTVAAVGWAGTFAPAADAFVGPGAGMGLLGVLLALVAAILLALFGFVLCPMRRDAPRMQRLCV